MASCFNHEDREGTARCAVCGKSLCEECTVSADGMTFCSEECKAKGGGGAARSGEVLAEKAKTDGAKTIRVLIFVFVVILVVAAAAVFLKGNGKDLNKKTGDAVKQIQQGAQKSAASVRKAVK